MLNEIITVYAIIDDLLKAIAHDEDCRRQMSDAEIITTAVCAAMFFHGNHNKACCYLKDHNLIPHMLEKSRFNRRLHGISMLINDLFHQIGMILKEVGNCTEYLLDSFPVPICDNIRIFNVNLIKSKEYRGYTASKKRYFYGVKIQLLTTKSGIPVEFVFMPGSANDVRALNALPLNLPPGSEVYSDSAYTDYTAEDDLEQTSQISLKVMRKKNSKRQDAPWNQYIKQHTRHYIETVFSSITRVFPKSIHACTYEGFLLKLEAFILAFTIRQAFLE
ncbi:IS982 family transposase [Scytonema hofmannii FACHB-248]|uniref:IS982 family transposase n=1 Tax=Scytonema hofmannii FACHB-248 TaxID=1842502 RepID=A0ABR8H0M6_9CYAN|nr:MULTISPECIES: IS982 family transposase [Nostocales]MBD2609371.1 IS982 family transposase [Scytonema hofmannii FACHB-248]